MYMTMFKFPILNLFFSFSFLSIVEFSHITVLKALTTLTILTTLTVLPILTILILLKLLYDHYHCWKKWSAII